MAHRNYRLGDMLFVIVSKASLQEVKLKEGKNLSFTKAVIQIDLNFAQELNNFIEQYRPLWKNWLSDSQHQPSRTT